MFELGERMKQIADQRLKDKLSKNHICYVLITCDRPSADGEMTVEMSYDGDAALAAYLLQGAQMFLDDQEEVEDIPVSLVKG